MTPHVWLAEAEDADDVARLIGGFRDWWGKDDRVTRSFAGPWAG